MLQDQAVRHHRISFLFLVSWGRLVTVPFQENPLLLRDFAFSMGFRMNSAIHLLPLYALVFNATQGWRVRIVSL
jgi:hypothetical protein